jgi:peptidyl-prolyl cis-trans isomerase A (cyclophilin A)
MKRRYFIGLGLILALIMMVSGLAAAQAESEKAKEEAPAEAAKAAKKAEEPEKESNPLVVMETSKGKLVIELYPKEAPITVENFLHYVNTGYYNGTVFHRVIPGFVIQGGGMTADMQRKKTYAAIENEADNGLKNMKYTLSMARTNDPNSATSQFFINLRDNTTLDHSETNAGYAVFGRVIRGTDIVDAIAKVETTTKGQYRDVPVQPVTVTKAYVETGDKTEEGKATEAKKEDTTKKKAAAKKAKEAKAKDN